ncbi:hypothetical protein CJU90_6305 [Yarrowia sp. C11]|nr:hypothetical protein CJU90_6305 [Yarrowia sp. C11]KAG5371010.1 hypothetical protein CKK34_1146 [Yarrowia sp. E02]
MQLSGIILATLAAAVAATEASPTTLAMAAATPDVEAAASEETLDDTYYQYITNQVIYQPEDNRKTDNRHQDNRKGGQYSDNRSDNRDQDNRYQNNRNPTDNRQTDNKFQDHHRDNKFQDNRDNRHQDNRNQDNDDNRFQDNHKDNKFQDNRDNRHQDNRDADNRDNRFRHNHQDNRQDNRQDNSRKIQQSQHNYNTGPFMMTVSKPGDKMHNQQLKVVSTQIQVGNQKYGEHFTINLSNPSNMMANVGGDPRPSHIKVAPNGQLLVVAGNPSGRDTWSYSGDTNQRIALWYNSNSGFFSCPNANDPGTGGRVVYVDMGQTPVCGRTAEYFNLVGGSMKYID